MAKPKPRKNFILKFLIGIILFLGSFSVIAPAYCAETVYPQLDISGFKKWEYKKADVSPSKNYFSGLTQLGGYYPTFTGGPWQERLQLKIFGQLSNELGVTYDLEQQPETPDRYDVTVKYNNHALTFGDLSANFSGNEFAQASKTLNGVMYTGKESWYDITFVPSSKLKSQTQSLTAQYGNNTKGPYNLGRSSIVEGSEKIELNNVPLRRNIDYTIDYFEGKVTFNRILTTADEFKYSYEYTNILDMFFPSLSKRDFFGFQSRFTIDPEEFGKPLPKPEASKQDSRQSFPTITAGEPDPDITEKESAGKYQLEHNSVVPFSEHLTFMGSELNRNEDYMILYSAGEIQLYTRLMPTKDDFLVVEYQYYLTSFESEMINGIDSRGPYKLAHKNLVLESEKIELNGKLMVKNLDYSIDYTLGELLFSVVVSPTSQINAKYSYNVMALPVGAPSKFPKTLKIGTTYLRESSKAGGTATTNTAIESFNGQKIITSNYHINLSNRPLVPSGEAEFKVIVTLNGKLLTPEVDYAIPTMVLDPATGFYMPTPEATLAYRNDRTDPSNGYVTGTIKILNSALISSTSEATVTYTYKKSVVGKFSGSGDGTRGPYFLKNIRNIAPGTEVAQVWNQGSSSINTYTRNSSFEANAADTGYSINYNSDNPSILFNNALDTNKNFQLIFQYVPPLGATSDVDLSQSVVGLDGGFAIGDIFKVDGAVARSEVSNYLAPAPTNESFYGNGNKTYSLHSSSNIIENSEDVYVNEKLLNKDIDYYFGYTSPGQITFYYIAPASLDAIRIDYDYQSASSAIGEITAKAANAYKVYAETKVFKDVLSLSGSAKKIDDGFNALGATSIGNGSSYQDYALKFKPEFHSFFADYSYKENNNPLGAYKSRYLRSYDNSIITGINPWNTAKINFTYRTYNTLDDRLPGALFHSNDTVQESYALNLVPNEIKRGQLSFTQNYDLKKTDSKTDAMRDSNNYSNNIIEYSHLNFGLKLTERLSAGLDYQLSEPKTLALQTLPGGTIEAESSHNRSIDNSYNLALDLTVGPLKKFQTRISRIDHTEITLTKNFVPTDESIVTKNETYHIDFVPIAILTSSYDHNRQEKLTFVVGGANPKNEKTAAAIKLAPVSWFSLGWSGANSEAIPDTGIANRTSGKGNAYTLVLIPLALAKVGLSANFTVSDNNQTAPSGTTGEVATLTNSLSQNYNLTLNVVPFLPLAYGLTIEDYRNKNDHPVLASRIDTQTQNLTHNLGTSVNPLTPLTLSANYNLKITRVIQDLIFIPQDKKKSVLTGKASYQVTSWGTALYEMEEEKNQGEIQAGAVADLNFEKNTKTISFNFTIPLDNPVLSSFIFIASMKNVEYKNLSNSEDNFNASLLSFEGTLNF